jgi:hypothetical protein
MFIVTKRLQTPYGPSPPGPLPNPDIPLFRDYCLFDIIGQRLAG